MIIVGKNGSCKLTESQVKNILKERIQGTTYKKLSIKYEISLSNVQQICERKTWKHIKED